MATLEMKVLADVRMRELLEHQGLPAPDVVEYGFGSVRFYFKDTMTCVVVDIDDPDPSDENELGLARPT